MLTSLYLAVAALSSWAFEICDWRGAVKVGLIALALFLQAEHQGWEEMAGPWRR